MSFNKHLKPETIARRAHEEVVRQADNRARFLVNYENARKRCKLPEPPSTGTHFSADLPDGRAVIVTANGLSIF